jgi:hypothetical protein
VNDAEVLRSDTAAVLSSLGYVVHTLSYELAVPIAEVRSILEKWPKSEVTKLIRVMPDIFAYSRTPARGIFFAVTRQTSAEERQVLRRYYSRDVLIVHRDREGELVAKWIDRPDSEYFEKLVAASQINRFGTRRELDPIAKT